MPYVWVEVKRVRDAQGCWCVDCNHLIADQANPYWHWTKSKAMHMKHTGHKVINVALSEEPEKAANSLKE